MRPISLLVAAALVSAAARVSAQTATTSEVDSMAATQPPVPRASSVVAIHAGMYGGILPSTISLSGLPGVSSCCPEYTSASGWTAGLEIGASYLLSSSILIEGGLGVLTLQPATTVDEVVPMNARFQTVDGTIRHSISVSSIQLNVSIGVAARLAPGMHVMLRPSMLLPLSASFTQTEELVSPEDVEFIDGSSTWNNADGPLAVSAVITLSGGIRYSVDFDPVWSVGPELWYHYAVTDLVEQWTVHRLSLGVTLMRRL